MTSISDFLAMGGYAVFVWPCFLLTALVLGGFLVTSLRDLKARERRLAELERLAPVRSRRRDRRAAAEDPATPS